MRQSSESVLTKARRQIRVGELAAEGFTRYEIARELGIAIQTVTYDLDAMDYEGVPRGRRLPIRKPPDEEM